MILIFNQYVSAKTLLLMLIESSLIVMSLIFAVRLRFWSDPLEFESYVEFPGFGMQAAIVVVIFQLCFHYGDLYNFTLVRRRFELIAGVGQSAGAACLVLGVLYYLFPALLIGRGVFFIAAVMVVSTIILNRVAMDRAWDIDGLKQRVLILGCDELALSVARELGRRDDLNTKLIGFAAEQRDHPNHLFGHAVLGSVADLKAITHKHNIHRIIVAVANQRESLPVRDLVQLRVQGIRIEEAHPIIAALTGRVSLDTVKSRWFVFSDGFRRSQLNLILKRAIDLIFATVGLVASLPIMVLTAIAIRLDSKGDVIYRQERVGLRGKSFNVLKFRSMRADAEVKGAQWAQQNDPRVTRIGKFIRKCRIDELPQFINVIRGDMSFVGPRPERPVFVEKLRQEILYYDERHSVRPGITGWAQVQYPYGSTVEDALRKLEYDLFYLKNMSLSFDCAIILQTVRTVLTAKGAR